MLHARCTPTRQLLFDFLEPMGYVHGLWQEPLPNTPAHEVLIQYGLGDAQVTWLGGLTIGRSIGCHMF